MKLVSWDQDRAIFSYILYILADYSLQFNMEYNIPRTIKSGREVYVEALLYKPKIN